MVCMVGVTDVISIRSFGVVFLSAVFVGTFPIGLAVYYGELFPNIPVTILSMVIVSLLFGVCIFFTVKWFIINQFGDPEK